MARIRTIKPEFWVSSQVVECSTNARLLFVGLWNFCDDQGVHEVSAKQLKMEIFPGDSFSSEDVAEWMNELIRNRLVMEINVPQDANNDLQVIAGKRFWYVTGWHHQKIDKPRTKYPNLRTLIDDSTNIRRTVDERSGSSRLLYDAIRSDAKRSEPIRSEPKLPDAKPPIVPQGGRAYPACFNAWWEHYPKQRRTDKQKAFAAYKRAGKRIIADDSRHLNKEQAAEFLRSKAAEFAASPIGQTKFAPAAHRWLDNGRYDDDPSAWNCDDDQTTPKNTQPDDYA